MSGCNCAGGPNRCSCGAGYSCCSQKGNENTFGLCIRDENGCDKKNGLAKIRSKPEDVYIIEEDSESYRGPRGPREGYSNDVREYYGGQCKSWKVSFTFLAVITLILLFMLNKRVM